METIEIKILSPILVALANSSLIYPETEILHGILNGHKTKESLFLSLIAFKLCLQDVIPHKVNVED